MRIGPYELTAIETGRFWLDGGAMFGSVPKALWSKHHPADELNRIELVSRSLLIRAEGRVVLVDAGCGGKLTEKQRKIYGFDNSQNELFRSLQDAGVSAREVTDVILTHLHFDHAGGATLLEGDAVRPAFPNARYHVQRAHWEHALQPTEKDRASFLEADFLPLVKTGALRFLDGAGELFPRVSAIICEGHTTSQQLPIISDGHNTLLYCGDLIPTAAHVPLPYIMAYDLRPLQTLAEKRQVLTEAAAGNWTLFFQHDARVVTAKIASSDKGFVCTATSTVL